MLDCAKAVLAASAPTRAPTRTDRFILASKSNGRVKNCSIVPEVRSNESATRASSALGDDDVAAEGPDDERGAAVTEYRVRRAPRAVASAVVARGRRTERDRKLRPDG